MDRLDTIVPAPEHSEYGEIPQHPGDIVNQDVARPEQNRGSEDRVGQSGFQQRSLQDRLAAKIGQDRIFARIRNADVNKPPDPRLDRAAHQGPRVVNSQSVGGIAVGETNPIGVVDHSRAAKVFGQCRRIVETQWPRSNAIPERTRRLWAICKSLYPNTPIEQFPCDIPPGKSECPGHNMKLAIRHVHMPRASNSLVTIGDMRGII